MRIVDNFRVMAVSPETFPGDMNRCYESITAVIDDAVSQKVSLLLLPELCITSSSCGELFRYKSILSDAEKNALRIARYTKGKDIICCISFPMLKEKSIYSVAALAFDGQIRGIVPLPKNNCIVSDVFSEYTGDDTCLVVDNRRVPFGKGLRLIIETYPDLVIGIGKTPEKCKDAAVYLIPDALLSGIGRQTRVEDWCRAASRKNRCTVVYCSSGEGETNAFGVFSGQTAIAQEGNIIAESPPFGSGRSVADVKLIPVSSDRPKKQPVFNDELVSENIEYPGIEYEPPASDTDSLPFLGNRRDLALRCEEAFEIQSRSLAGRLKKTGIAKTVLGISGGLDSTLALLVSVRAMEILGRSRTNVIAVSMPCFGTSNRTKTNAQILCKKLGVDFRVIDISTSVRQHLSDIGHDAGTADTAYENAQARERTQVLMDLSNMENGLVVGTGDMSEAALGWCTFNGDHMSMYNVNCSITKTLIRSIVSHYADLTDNQTIRDVLMDIVATPVSPELKPVIGGEIAQKTEEIIGPYDAHDFFLYHFIRNSSAPSEILDLAVSAFAGTYTREQLKYWLMIFIKRFFQNQFKRNCSPDGPIIGSVSLSPAKWMMPGDYLSIGLVSELK